LTLDKKKARLVKSTGEDRTFEEYLPTEQKFEKIKE